VTDLAKKVLESIEKGGLAPRPYAYFLAKRSVFWTLAALSILLGAVSVAVLIFATQDYLATGGRGFDEMPLDDVFEYLPYVWLATLAAFLASAYYAMRHTPGGYRYKTWQLLSAALAICGALGVALHAADAGRRVHGFLSRTVPAYDSITRSPAKVAPAPALGVLTGAVQSFDGKSMLTLKDFTGKVWSVDVTGAKITLDAPLGGEEDVEIKGVQTGPAAFHAQSIADWD
jgi:hypothetical protein